jgi:hypothetical protein
MLHSLYHGRRLVNGYSAIIPRLGGLLWRFPEVSSIEALQAADVRYVIVHRDGAPGGGASIDAIRRAGLQYREFGEALVVEIPPAGASAPTPPPGEELDRSRWRLTGSAPGAELAADGDTTTHWQDWIADRESFLRVDFGREEMVTGVTLWLGAHFREYPERYHLRASLDGTKWFRVGGARHTRPPLASYRRDHLDLEVPLPMRPVPARHLELLVPRAGPMGTAFWGVHELQIFVRPER